MGHAHSHEQASPSSPEPDVTPASVSEDESQTQSNASAQEELASDPAPAAKGEEPQKLSGGILDQDASKKALDSAFGTLKKFDAGKVNVLKQAAFETAYDKIYGSGQYSWALYVKPKFGNLEGFAYKGTNYINADCASVDTVPHEMLHNNCASDWTPTVGSEFNEGTTEYMTIYAMKKLGKTPSHSYPNQEAVVTELVSNGLSQNDLFKAYLSGGADKLVAKWVDDNCKGNWADVKKAMQATDWATAKTHIKKK